MASRGSRMFVAAFVMLWTVTGCTTTAAAPEPVVSVAPPVEPSGDGTLVVGTLAASGTPAGIAEVAGVEVAIRELSEAGGVAGVAPRVHHRDSGNGRLDASVSDLLARSVDVIVGPPSAPDVQQILPATSAGGIPVLSPETSGDAITDGGGIAFGMVPAQGVDLEALASALVEKSRADGADEADADVAILAPDEVTSDAVAAALDAAGLSIVDTEIVADAASAASAVSDLSEAEPTSVVVALPTAEVASAALVALDAGGFDGDDLWLTAGATVDFSGGPAAGVVAGVHGLSLGTGSSDFAARVLASDPAATDLGFAAEAYDAVIIAALAVVVAGDDGGASIAQRVPEVTSGGIPCASFAECLSVLETEADIAYVGPSGVSNLTADGGASVSFGRVRYVDGGTFEPVTP